MKRKIEKQEQKRHLQNIMFLCFLEIIEANYYIKHNEISNKINESCNQLSPHFNLRFLCIS